MNPEEYNAYLSMKNAYEAQKAENTKQNLSHAASSVFQAREDQNLIEYQLELDNILERLEHLLRGHVLRFDKKGNLDWRESENEDFKIFNEYGVQEILRILSMYLNRNTILSNYDEPTINWKVYDLGIELTDLVFMKYEEMGLDSDSKIKLYMIVCRQLIDTVHSAYLRALHGGERESLRTARTVTQSESQNPNSNFEAIMPSQRSKKWYNPFTWGK